jgi:hypothetical protein
MEPCALNMPMMSKRIVVRSTNAIRESEKRFSPTKVGSICVRRGLTWRWEAEAHVTRWESGVKTHLGFLTLTSMAIQGATRRQLIAELFRLIRSKGDYANSRDEITRWGEDWLSILPFLGVTSLLLFRPRAASWLVKKTVANYSLTPDGAKTIREMDQSVLANA